MENLDINGLFWDLDKLEDKVAGQLHFTPERGAELALFSHFEGVVYSSSVLPARIHAVAGGRIFTLESMSSIERASSPQIDGYTER